MPADKGPTRVLGLDPGTILLGYGLVALAGEAVNGIAWGAIRAPARLPLPQRLVQLHRGLTEVLSNLTPDEVAVEEVFVSRNWRTALTLGHAHAIALLAAAQAGLPVATYAASTVKEAVAGFGGAGKAQVQSLVAQHLGLDAPPKPDHAADALAVALCHLWRGGLARRLTDPATGT